MARGAIHEGLRTHTLEELVDLVKQPCRDAALKAARNKRDKDAQLRREYHNTVMDFLEHRSSRRIGCAKYPLANVDD